MLEARSLDYMGPRSAMIAIELFFKPMPRGMHLGIHSFQIVGWNIPIVSFRGLFRCDMKLVYAEDPTVSSSLWRFH